MNMSEKRSREWWDERIESFVDGALEENEDREIRETLSVDRFLADEILIAQSIRDGLRAMSMTTCPDHVSRDIRSAISTAARAETLAKLRDYVRQSLSGYRRFALVGAILVAALLGVLTVQRDQVPSEPTITQALDDVKWTLALVSGVSNDAAGVVRSDVFEQLVYDNIGRTLDVLGETQN